MRILIGLVFFLMLSPFCVGATECTTGYEPAAAAFYVAEGNIYAMDLAEPDKAAALKKLSEFQARQSALRNELRNIHTDIAMELSAPSPDRGKTDALAGHFLDVLKELDDLDVFFAVDMADLLKGGSLRKIKIPARRNSRRCDEALVVPETRYILSGAEKKLIELSEEEAKYLKDFELREKYFSVEKARTRASLDKVMRVKSIDRTRVSPLLDELHMLTKQQITNRLDRYFYAEQILFTPVRMDKLNAFRVKHKKQ